MCAYPKPHPCSTRADVSDRVQAGIGGFEKGEFVRDSARKEVAAQICVRRADTVRGGRTRGSDGSNSAPSSGESIKNSAELADADRPNRRSAPVEYSKPKSPSPEPVIRIHLPRTESQERTLWRIHSLGAPRAARKASKGPSGPSRRAADTTSVHGQLRLLEKRRFMSGRLLARRRQDHA